MKQVWFEYQDLVLDVCAFESSTEDELLVRKLRKLWAKKCKTKVENIRIIIKSEVSSSVRTLLLM
jgi:hypothetical protein